ncbi:hypothetical protein AVEN_2559-1 [Araneus ventricosus]|uniref:Uncharacterized protein n=1 Tax=Araneus ventricosus TaxID=182803 RepID=A0A4Y2GSP8_ARAVE|nr:hypothetical protein AVEN_2559-1 [Araneus ventricosus]
MSPLFNRGYNYVENIPTLPAVKAQVYRIRRKEQEKAVEPKSSQDIEIMDDYVIMEDGSSFLLDDDDSASVRGDKSKVLDLFGITKTMKKLVSMYASMYAALAYLPESDMDDGGWLCIQETSP